MSSLPLEGNNSEQRRHVNIVPAVDETAGGCGAVEGFDCYPIALTDGLAAYGGVEQQQGVELQADTIPYPPQGKIGTKKDDEDENENINDDLLLNENGNNHDDDDDDNVESPLFLNENDIVTYQEWLPERRNARARRRRGAVVAGCFGLSVETIATKIGRSPIIVSFGTTTTSKSLSSSSSPSSASVCQQQQIEQPQPQLQHHGDLCIAADPDTKNNNNNNNNNNHQMKQRISTGTLIPTATTIKKNILDFYDESEFTRDSRSSSNSNNNNKPLSSSSSSSSSSPTSTIYHPPPLSPPKTNHGSGGCFDFQMDSILSSIECTLLHKVMCTDEEEEK
ncbi:hypothetical protein FRACYDRAFT_240948 [Fragilariopsis cylindrus CCMP1102]|uniref:Uncharacterized protein n=1 Tax=Fragilariopsis cylindrus CCMP1102 TaxID=635003 RepID=A0A1E7F8E1_9STRA|nr:hypothetical protein FRACYDRAFT_240948 [Fragilariopsis cylindrus CCMP1102]|eukprot:OEU14409.1 hypothetical protein FRACYDRAFT_240948 [Fragilariopsis cylindrus CCMP1102]